MDRNLLEYEMPHDSFLSSVLSSIYQSRLYDDVFVILRRVMATFANLILVLNFNKVKQC